MDSSVRQRGSQMDKPTGNQAKHHHRPPARVSSSNKQVPHHKPRHQVQSASTSSNAPLGSSQSLKKSGPSRIYVDSSRGPVLGYDHSPAVDLDSAYDSEDSYGMGSPQGPSPSEMWEPHHESLLSASNIRSSSNGAKKVSRSANHLLNFSYPARERPVASTYNRPKLVHAPYRRERFVQANFRFIVSKDGEYSDNLTDPDAVIDWDLVEFVIYGQSSSDPTTCSICIDAPTCPRVAKCGHVFCWPCILQLFSYHERSSIAPCPVCLREKISVVDLRPVIFESFHAPTVNATMDFSLLQRPKHLNLLFPAQHLPTIDPKSPLPFLQDTSISKFNRLVVTPVLGDLLRSEASALETAIESAKASNELTLYHEIALGMLQDELTELDAKPSTLTSTTTLLSPLSKPAPKQKLSDLIPATMEPDDCYFFYQAMDGQQIFLHPLNWHYISKEHVHRELPTELKDLKVLDVEVKTLDEKLRRKSPTLSHLPASCQYHLALVDMTGVLKDPLNLAAFSDDVKKRADSIAIQNQREARHAAVIAEQAAAKRTADLIQSLTAGSRSAAPEVVPPDLDDHFPEIGSLSLSTHLPTPSVAPTSSAALTSSSPSKTPMAWGNGRLMASLHRGPEEEFPALPPGHMVLSDTAIEASPSPSSMRFSEAVSSPHPAHNTPSNSSKSNSKKKGKKTILVL